MSGGEQEPTVQDKEVNIRWFNVNVPTIVTVLGALVTITAYINSIEAKVVALDTARTRLEDSINKRSIYVDAQLAPMATLPFRMSAVESSVIEANKRVDRISDLVLSSVDTIRNSVNGLATKVEVQSSKIDDLTKKVDNLSVNPKPTSFRP